MNPTTIARNISKGKLKIATDESWCSQAQVAVILPTAAEIEQVRASACCAPACKRSKKTKRVIGTRWGEGALTLIEAGERVRERSVSADLGLALDRDSV